MRELYLLYWKKHHLVFPLYAYLQHNARKLINKFIPKRFHPNFQSYERIRFIGLICLLIYLIPVTFCILQYAADPNMFAGITILVFLLITLYIGLYKLTRRIQFYLADFGRRIRGSRSTKDLVFEIDGQIDSLLSSLTYEQLNAKADSNLFILKRLQYHYQKCNQYKLSNSNAWSANNRISTHILSLETKAEPLYQ